MSWKVILKGTCQIGVLLSVAVVLSACGGGSSSTAPPMPPPDDPGGDNGNEPSPCDGLTGNYIRFVSAEPACGETAVANPFAGVDFTVCYGNASEEPAAVSVGLFDAAGNLVGGGGNHRNLPAGSSGTAVADANADEPGVTSSRVEFRLRGRETFSTLASASTPCEHTWE